MPLILVFACLSVALVGGYRYLALRRGWLDAPNSRSSHQEVVPRGAGIVIVALAMAAAAAAPATTSVFFSSLLPGLGIAAAGWWDDLHGLSSRVRFVVYGTCSLLALAALHAFPLTSGLGWLWLAAGTFGLLWLINLYNFMDGINGLAAFEALFVLGASLALSPHSPYAAALQTFSACMMAIVAGFALWNFPLARVFMGDVGSAFLGFLLGLLAFWSHSLAGPGPAVWAILGALFIADASYTLSIRIATGQRWYSAHRSHAYQKLSIRWASHGKAVAAMMGVNLAWLLPLAWAAQHRQLATETALLLAYAPLIALCYVLKAGIPAGTKV